METQIANDGLRKNEREFFFSVFLEAAGRCSLAAARGGEKARRRRQREDSSSVFVLSFRSLARSLSPFLSLSLSPRRRAAAKELALSLSLSLSLSIKELLRSKVKKKQEKTEIKTHVPLFLLSFLFQKLKKKTGPAPGRLANRATSFIEEHRVRGYEVGPDRGSSITTIANLLQEVAGNHAVALWGRTDAGYATDPIMVARNLIFAATRIQIQMDEYPKWGDMVQVETWFQEEGRVAATRNWLLRDALSGRPLGRATSTWVMVNTKTRRLAKMPDEMRAKMDLLAPNPPRDSVPSSQARLKIPDLAFLEEEANGAEEDESRRESGSSTSSSSGSARSSSDDDSSELSSSSIIEGPKQVARRADMDMNGHINNVTYLAWALETVPSDVYDGMTLSEVEIDYKSECLAGHAVECLAAPTEREKGTSTSDRKAPADAPGARAFVHTLRRCDEERCYELVRARTTWRPASDGKKKR